MKKNTINSVLETQRLRRPVKVAKRSRVTKMVFFRPMSSTRKTVDMRPGNSAIVVQKRST